MKSAIFTDDSFGYAAIEEAIEYFSVAFRYDIVAVVSITGLPWEEIGGIPVYTSDTLAECLDILTAETEISTVLDVTSYCFEDKFAFADAIINKGLALFGADYRIFPPQTTCVDSPGTIAVLGNRNFGKTAVVAYIKKIGLDYRSIVSVAADPRAPRYPIIVEPDKIWNGYDYSGLAAEHRAGQIINLYHYAVALTAGIPAFSSTFAGTGFSGVPYASLNTDAILLATEYDPDLIVLLSDKSVVPRASFDSSILIIDSGTNPDEMGMYPYLYKLRSADIVILLSPYGASKARTNKLSAKIEDIYPDSKIFKATEYPALLNKPEASSAFLVYSERNEIVHASQAYIKKKYSIKIREVIDSSKPIPTQSDLKTQANTDKSCFILDLFDDNFADWLDVLTKANIPIAILSRELAPSPKKAFDTALKTVLNDTFTAGQERLATAEAKAEELQQSEEAALSEGDAGEDEARDTEERNE